MSLSQTKPEHLLKQSVEFPRTSYWGEPRSRLCSVEMTVKWALP